MVQHSYKYLLTEDWDGGSVGYRAERITDMIVNAKKPLTVQDMVWPLLTPTCTASCLLC